MSDECRIAVVDDVAAMRKLYEGVLRSQYQLDCFADGVAFLESGITPDAIVLDIEMPGVDGYETCRRLRDAGMDRVQVIFASAHDSDEERMRAYQSGGDDFITKPVVADELRAKVAAALRRRQVLRNLESQSSMAQQIAFSAMSSMGALGVILDFMRGSAEVTAPDALGARLIEALRAWGLNGAVRIRSLDSETLAHTQGECSPLQQSVIKSLKDMGRIFQMRSRAVVNYPNVSILVENLPVDDEEAIGRMRDNLAMLGETAETMVRGLNAMAERDRQQGAARSTMRELEQLLGSTSALSTQNRARSEQVLHHGRDDIQSLARGFGLTGVQESMICDEMDRVTAEMLQLFDEATQIDAQFSRILARLQMMGGGEPGKG
ncbi:MAG: response regulator transcription factor [Rhodocyclaceae bacterium]|nr:response regulator transcription factor [Rhodocyclaceae bacterium]